MKKITITIISLILLPTLSNSENIKQIESESNIKKTTVKSPETQDNEYITITVETVSPEIKNKFSSIKENLRKTLKTFAKGMNAIQKFPPKEDRTKEQQKIYDLTMNIMDRAVDKGLYAYHVISNTYPIIELEPTVTTLDKKGRLYIESETKLTLTWRDPLDLDGFILRYTIILHQRNVYSFVNKPKEKPKKEDPPFISFPMTINMAGGGVTTPLRNELKYDLRLSIVPLRILWDVDLSFEVGFQGIGGSAYYIPPSMEWLGVGCGVNFAWPNGNKFDIGLFFGLKATLTPWLSYD